ncbi:TraB/GumN family protein [Ruegeria sp.]|uniref:TraB/GumN family protein n=1 Tax=Ruegeria sp. TaxID=1879320 RepID=UPI00231230FA|nr:TraB/GumN family protein [Ruegeria sp.]MDA7965773.1 TraB/GumN family protein [Ruegeria sp.]
MRLILFVICLLLPAAAQAACEGRDLKGDLPLSIQAELKEAVSNIPYPEGNHWIATKGNTVLHLVGTLHLNAPQMGALVERLTPVLSQADAFYFEVTQDEMKAWEQRLAADPSPIMITSGPSLIDIMPEEDWATLSAMLTERGIPSWVAAKMRPWFLGMMLGMPTCMLQDPQADHGLDSRLTDLALEHDIPQYSLESIDDLMGVFDIYSIEEQAHSLARMVGTYKNSDDQMATMTKAYFDEQHWQVMELGRLIAREYSGLSPEEFDKEWSPIEQHLLIERNNNWMLHILSIQDQTAVIAVGAGHLSGTFGLLNQLHQADYTLERAPF